MKKLTLLLLVLLTSGAGGLFAEINESPLYAKTLLISKVILHQKGYMINYFRADGAVNTIYIPIEWFLKSKKEFLTDDGFIKAEIQMGDSPSFPYMTIFYKDNRFHHLRLFLRADKNDPSWGLINFDVGKYFDPKKELELKY